MRSDRGLSVSELAERVGVSPAMIRQWERQKLIPEPDSRVRRGQRWDRRYSAAQVTEIGEIARRLAQPGRPDADRQAMRRRLQRQHGA